MKGMTSTSKPTSTYQQDLGIVMSMAILSSATESSKPTESMSRRQAKKTRDPITNQKYKAVQQQGRSRSRPNQGMRKAHNIMQPRPGF